MTDIPIRHDSGFAVVRSRFIDAHASVEAAVITRLRSIGLEVQPLFGQNIESLLKAKPAPTYSKATKARIDEALNEVKAVQCLRQDLVHSEMKIASIAGEQFACFINPQRSESEFMRPTLVAEQGLRDISRKLEKLGKDIVSS